MEELTLLDGGVIGLVAAISWRALGLAESVVRKFRNGKKGEVASGLSINQFNRRREDAVVNQLTELNEAMHTLVSSTQKSQQQLAANQGQIIQNQDRHNEVMQQLVRELAIVKDRGERH